MTLPSSCDLLVVGSGAGGLATAVTAAHLGLNVVVVEKEATFGGTTAWSGGWLWVPRNPLAVAAGIDEPIDEPKRYLRSELGNAYDDALATIYLEQAPRMVAFFKDRTAVDWIDGNTIPDFHDHAAGSRNGGRSVCAAPFDGRLLGRRLADLKPPLDLVSPWGMAVAAGADMRHFLFATRALASFQHVAQRTLRHFADRVRHGRGMHLVNGNALVARLLKSCDDLGVTLVKSADVTELTKTGDRVTGARVRYDGRLVNIAAGKGVVLACGGFPHDNRRKAQQFAHAPSGVEHHSAAPPSNTGDGLRLGETAGGTVRRDLANAGAWAPVSLVPQAGGRFGRFPHLIERGKPGLIMVRRDGRRFANEANSYHDVMQALFAATPKDEPVECWLICDTTFRNNYGLGRVRPRPFPVLPWLRNGYLKRGASIGELAKACGIDPDGLSATVERHNGDCEAGTDTAFGRGGSSYNRIQGEAGDRANPCMSPIARGPFYAVRIVPGSLGTFAGLKTDAQARVLNAHGKAIDGLFAAGNDMSSMMGGYYPAGGITLGPAMTFGYIVAHVAAGLPLTSTRAQAT